MMCHFVPSVPYPILWSGPVIGMLSMLSVNDIVHKCMSSCKEWMMVGVSLSHNCGVNLAIRF